MTKTQKIAGATVIASAFALPMEGIVTHVYKDPVGINTVCVGHTGAGVVLGKTYTLDECKALLDQDMRQAVTIVEDCWPNRLPIKTLAAFADLTYNVGPKAVCDIEQSAMARKLASWDIEGACREMVKWNKGRIGGVLVTLPGLVKRREAEMQLCLEGLRQ